MDPMGTIPWSYFTPVSDIEKKHLRMNAPLTFQCPEKHPRKKGEKITGFVPNDPKWLSRDGNQVHLGPIEVQSGTAPRLPDAAETGTRLVWIMAWGRRGHSCHFDSVISTAMVETHDSVCASYICAWFSVIFLEFSLMSPKPMSFYEVSNQLAWLSRRPNSDSLNRLQPHFDPVKSI